jgi:hypothetical protein
VIELVTECGSVGQKDKERGLQDVISEVGLIEDPPSDGPNHASVAFEEVVEGLGVAGLGQTVEELAVGGFE